MRSNFFVSVMIAALLFPATIAQAEPTNLIARERELYEKMLDITALTRSGVSYQEYAKHLPELVVLYDRYERSGGANLGLYFAKKDLLEAKEDWDRLNEKKSRRTPASQSSAEIVALEIKIEQNSELNLQSDWSAAAEHLQTYANEAAVKGKKVGKPAKAGKAKGNTTE